VTRPLVISMSEDVSPAKERVKELAVRPVTSPRLRGEVGMRALARGSRVRGKGPLHNGEWLYNREEAPHPNPLHASGARENRAAVISQCLISSHALSRE